MTFYILMNQITTLFLSVNLLTTLSFDSEVVSYLYGGSKEEMFFSVTNNNKTLALKPLTEKDLSNLLVITKQRKYYFNLRVGGNAHQFIEVKHGTINHAFKKFVDKEGFEVLEGSSSILFINKKDRSVRLNEQVVKDKAYISKGVPLILEGTRVLN